MTQYVAFLRGINVGGHKPVKMDQLAKTFESLGFQNVKTVLASGNVLFEAPETSKSTLVTRVEEGLKRALGHEVGVLVRTLEEIQALADADHFREIEVTPDTRMYVTFLSEETDLSAHALQESAGEDVEIVRVLPGQVCSVVTLSPGRGTTQLMAMLEKKLGRKVTTRNWNTITKLVKG